MNLENIRAIADHRGFNAQATKLVEEMAELTVAIMHLNRKDAPEKRKAEFIEELGDVLIIAEQIVSLLKPQERIYLSDSIEFKIDRELNRIRNEKRI